MCVFSSSRILIAAALFGTALPLASGLRPVDPSLRELAADSAEAFLAEPSLLQGEPLYAEVQKPKGGKGTGAGAGPPPPVPDRFTKPRIATPPGSPQGTRKHPAAPPFPRRSPPSSPSRSRRPLPATPPEGPPSLGGDYEEIGGSSGEEENLYETVPSSPPEKLENIYEEIKEGPRVDSVYWTLGQPPRGEARGGSSSSKAPGAEPGPLQRGTWNRTALRAKWGQTVVNLPKGQGGGEDQ